MNTANIDGFAVILAESGQFLYQYTNTQGTTSRVQTDGRTYARNIPLIRNTDDDTLVVSVLITASSTVHPRSDPFEVESCSQLITTASQQASTLCMLCFVFAVVKVNKES